MSDFLKLGKEVFEIQIAALNSIANRLDDSFNRAVDILFNAKGRVVVLGVGKSGLIGHKIASTFASTGTPSMNIHASDAIHGDLGMIRPIDVGLLISYSGETEELLRVIPFLKEQGNKIIALTGNMNSMLAKHADVVLDICVDRESCPNNLAPTTSTTATLVMGDALAGALVFARDFTPIDFARFHPGGSLGRRLLTRIRDVMHTDDLPYVRPDDLLRDVVGTMTSCRLGVALVMEDGVMKGLITDGDLRRALSVEGDPLSRKAHEIMTTNPLTITPDRTLPDAEKLMRDSKVKALVVVDASDSKKVVGVMLILDV